MKVSANFDIREFVSKKIYDRWGTDSSWFINQRVVNLAQFYRDFFTRYFRNKDANVSHVIIVINTWFYGGKDEYSGFREPEGKEGASLSQHRFCNAFDADIIIVYKDGTKKEADYKQIHKIIEDYNDIFMEAGLTAVESVEDAPTWLHSDCRWIPNQKKILTVRYKK